MNEVCQVRIVIECDNGAFYDDEADDQNPWPELNRLLRNTLPRKIESMLLQADERTAADECSIRDVNGNKCGTVTIEWRDE